MKLRPLPLILFVLALCAVIVAGCKTTNVQATSVGRVTTDYSELEKNLSKPKGTVKGQAFLKQRNGGVIKAAGNVIILNPVNEMSQQYVDVVILNKDGNLKVLEPISPEYMKYFYQAECDADGNFEFKDVPEGEYFIYTAITWEVPSRYGANTSGGWVLETTNVKANSENSVMLNHFARELDWWDFLSVDAVNQRLQR